MHLCDCASLNLYLQKHMGLTYELQLISLRLSSEIEIREASRLTTSQDTKEVSGSQ